MTTAHEIAQTAPASADDFAIVALRITHFRGDQTLDDVKVYPYTFAGSKAALRDLRFWTPSREERAGNPHLNISHAILVHIPSKSIVTMDLLGVGRRYYDPASPKEGNQGWVPGRDIVDDPWYGPVYEDAVPYRLMSDREFFDAQKDAILRGEGHLSTDSEHCRFINEAAAAAASRTA